eukprot:jgi/Ulvmu1/3708/UM170_0014.1
MDPVTVGAVVQSIIKVVRSVKAIINSWLEHTQNLQAVEVQAVEAFMTFLERMTDVLKEQRLDRVSRTGFRILQGIEAECCCVEDTATTFLQRHTVVRFVTGSATTMAEALRQSRVKLHEHWTLYLVSLSPAGAAPAATSQLQISSSHSNATISAHLSKLTAAVVVVNSGDAGAAQQLAALKNHPPGKLSDEQELELAKFLAGLQVSVAVPSGAFAAAAADTREQLSAMRTAMAESVASGSAGLNSQLEAIHQQIKEAALYMQEAAKVCTTDALTRQLALRATFDMGRRDITIADGEPSEGPAMRIVPNKKFVNDHLHIMTWAHCTVPEIPCWDLRQNGATLRAVTFKLPEHGQLRVLNEEKPGTWEDVCVEGFGCGSTVIISGAMELKRVKIIRCTLIVTDSASVSLTDCDLGGAHGAPLQVAAVVTGAGASVKFLSCSIRNCNSGVVVADGASLTLVWTRVECDSGSCVTVDGQGTSADMKDANLKLLATTVAESLAGPAVAAVLHGGMLKLQSSFLRQMTPTGATEECCVHGTESNGKAGVLVDAHSSAAMQECGNTDATP